MKNILKWELKLKRIKYKTKKPLSGFLAPRPGLEPGTNGLTVRCSTN